MSDPQRRYWDSNCFLAWIKGEKGRVEVCEDILQSAWRGECLIVTSAIAVAEVVRPRKKSGLEMTEAEDAKIVAFFRSPFLRFVDFNPTLGQLARQLQWRHNLSVRDAIHVASAIFAKVPVIESYDPDLLDLDPKRDQIPGCPEIRVPKGRPQMRLALEKPDVKVEPAIEDSRTTQSQPSVDGSPAVEISPQSTEEPAAPERKIDLAKARPSNEEKPSTPTLEGPPPALPPAPEGK